MLAAAPGPYTVYLQKYSSGPGGGPYLQDYDLSMLPVVYRANMSQVTWADAQAAFNYQALLVVGDVSALSGLAYTYNPNQAQNNVFPVVPKSLYDGGYIKQALTGFFGYIGTTTYGTKAVATSVAPSPSSPAASPVPTSPGTPTNAVNVATMQDVGTIQYMTDPVAGQVTNLLPEAPAVGAPAPAPGAHSNAGLLVLAALAAKLLFF